MLMVCQVRKQRNSLISKIWTKLFWCCFNQQWANRNLVRLHLAAKAKYFYDMLKNSNDLIHFEIVVYEKCAPGYKLQNSTQHLCVIVVLLIHTVKVCVDGTARKPWVFGKIKDEPFEKLEMYGIWFICQLLSQHYSLMVR